MYHVPILLARERNMFWPLVSSRSKMVSKNANVQIWDASISMEFASPAYQYEVYDRSKQGAALLVWGRMVHLKQN